jgi:hypothetical protein
MDFVGLLPLVSQMRGDELPIAVWHAALSDEIGCELNDDHKCVENGFLFGTSDENDPKFCQYHFFAEVVSGDSERGYRLALAS